MDDLTTRGGSRQKSMSKSGIETLLGIGEEALPEQKAEADRVEIGDGERIGDERTGAGAAARPDRDALLAFAHWMKSATMRK